MSRQALSLLGVFVLAVFVVFGSTPMARAESQKRPDLADSAFDLVNAVNALRASYGLAPYNINSILMYTAQGQADFMAATGSMTHSGPGGIGLTDRLLAAGYPLAGDLSLGGFRSENITGGSENMSAQAAVNSWTGDSLHLNTMISPNLSEIGAGVTVSAGKVYYVIDCALPTTGGAPQVGVTSREDRSAVPAAVLPVTVSTPNVEGDVIHEVKPGQSLWQIAITYGVRIDEIKSMNNLSDDNIYPGNKLFISRGIISSTGTPVEMETQTQTITSTLTSTLVLTALSHTVTSTPTPVVLASSVSTDNSALMRVAVGMIALAFLGGGIFAWLGDSKKDRAVKLPKTKENGI